MDVAMWAAYLQAFCRIFLALIFLLSSTSKLRDMVGFRTTIKNFQILPASFNNFVASLFVGSEIIIVILLVLGQIALLPGFLLATFLLGIFSLALISVLIRKLPTSCHCFGSSAKTVSRFDIWRNVGLLLCSLAGLFTQIGVERNLAPLNLFAWFFIGGLAVIIVLVWTQMREIIQLFRLNESGHP